MERERERKREREREREREKESGVRRSAHFELRDTRPDHFRCTGTRCRTRCIYPYRRDPSCRLADLRPLYGSAPWEMAKTACKESPGNKTTFESTAYPLPAPATLFYANPLDAVRPAVFFLHPPRGRPPFILPFIPRFFSTSVVICLSSFDFLSFGSRQHRNVCYSICLPFAFSFSFFFILSSNLSLNPWLALEILTDCFTFNPLTTVGAYWRPTHVGFPVL